jgi:hypothetical protein
MAYGTMAAGNGTFQPTVSASYAATLGTVQAPAPGVLGGMTPEVNPAPFYDPRTTSMRAPIAASGVPGELVTAPSLPHGPSLYSEGAEPPKPKTQFAPHGPITIEPILIGTVPVTCICAGATLGTYCASGNGAPGSCTYVPYSVTGPLLAPRNVLHVRNLLERAGIVVVTDSLRAALDKRVTPPCACNIMGDPELYNSFVAFASNYSDVSIAQLPNVAATILQLDEDFVSQKLAGIRSMVLSAAGAP